MATGRCDMRPFEHMTLPNRTLKHNFNTKIKTTDHFMERVKERGFGSLEVAQLLCCGKVTKIKNGCFRIKFLNVNLVVKPHNWGYLLITVFND